MNFEDKIKNIQSIISKHYTEEAFGPYRKDEMYYSYYIPQYIEQDASLNKVESVLDIGCGYGTLIGFAKNEYNCEAYAVDKFLSMPEELRKELGIQYAGMDVEFDPFPFDVKFDRIIFTEILEHLRYSPVPTLIKIKNQLRDDGYLYLSTPDAESEWGRITTFYNSIDEMPNLGKRDYVNQHVYQYTAAELDKIFDEAGLKIVEKKISNPWWGRHFNLKLSKE